MTGLAILRTKKKKKPGPQDTCDKLLHRPGDAPPVRHDLGTNRYANVTLLLLYQSPVANTVVIHRVCLRWFGRIFDDEREEVCDYHPVVHRKPVMSYLCYYCILLSDLDSL